MKQECASSGNLERLKAKDIIASKSSIVCPVEIVSVRVQLRLLRNILSTAFTTPEY